MGPTTKPSLYGLQPHISHISLSYLLLVFAFESFLCSPTSQQLLEHPSGHYIPKDQATFFLFLSSQPQSPGVLSWTHVLSQLLSFSVLTTAPFPRASTWYFWALPIMLLTPPPSPQLTTCLAPEDRLGCVLAGRLELVSILGIGAYGVVYQAVDILTNIPYAVKALPKVGLDSRQRRFQRREIALHHQASQHPNVVSLLRILDSPDCTFVVIEFCPEGDLFSNITEQGRFVGDDQLAKHAFLQILDAVQYCHSIGIYHRDLKPENVLVKDNAHTVKLADFGLATTDRISCDYGCGFTFYMSPECGQSRPYARYATAPNDVWSLGVILVNLTCGRNPWKRASPEDSTFRAFLKDSSFLSSILPISQELSTILQRIFECDPRHRITLDELRDLIIACPRFTTTSYHTMPPTPQSSFEYVETMDCANMALPPSPPQSPPPRPGYYGQSSHWSLFEPTSKQTSSYSDTSADSGYESETYAPEPGPNPFNFYGNVIPLQDHSKVSFYQQPTFAPTVAAY